MCPVPPNLQACVSEKLQSIRPQLARNYSYRKHLQLFVSLKQAGPLYTRYRVEDWNAVLVDVTLVSTRYCGVLNMMAPIWLWIPEEFFMSHTGNTD